jgi:HAD superfamily hydrolase (TIGR01509 family)
LASTPFYGDGRPLVPEIDLGRVKAVVFDVDGTLYRQGPLRRAMAGRLLRAHLLHPRRGRQTLRALSAYRRAQEELRTEPAGSDLAGAQLHLAAARCGLDDASVRAHVAEWMETAPLDLVARLKQPGLDELLSDLRSAGVRLAVLSDYDAAGKLDALGIARYFDVVVTAQQPDVGVFKPHPRGLRVVLERLGVEPADALYVGDRVDVDAAAAAAAGVPCVILLEEGRSGSPDSNSYMPITSFHDMRDRLVST